MKLGNLLTGGLSLTGLAGNLLGVSTPNGQVASLGGLSGTGNGTGLAHTAGRVILGGLTGIGNGTGPISGMLSAMSPEIGKYMPNSIAGMLGASDQATGQTKEIGDKLQNNLLQSTFENEKDNLLQGQLEQIKNSTQAIAVSFAQGGKSLLAVQQAGQ